MGRIDVRASGFLGWKSRLPLVGLSLFFKMQLLTVKGTLVQRLPNMKVAVGTSELEYTPPTQNVGVVHLPVWF